jgi:catechol 2,3-dioxygenase-like lactoylglutathione lyase family enzyme
MIALDHVEIYVSDLAQTYEFWNWLLTELGYSVFQKWEGGVSWIEGGTYIVFVQAPPAFLVHGYHRRRIGLNHLAFRVSSPQRVDDLTAELRRRGVLILYADRHPYAGGPEHYAVFFEDPDRIKVELVAS